MPVPQELKSPRPRQKDHCKAKCGHSKHPSKAHCFHAEISEVQGPQALLRFVSLQADNTGSPRTGRGLVSEQNPKAIPSAPCWFRGFEAAEGNPGAAHRVPDDLSKDLPGQHSHKQLPKSKPITTNWKPATKCHGNMHTAIVTSCVL